MPASSVRDLRGRPGGAAPYALLLAACVTACAGELTGGGRAPGASGGSTSDDGSADGGPNDFANPDASAIAADGGIDPLRPGNLPANCVGETQGAERVDVDMYVMLDRSGSMREVTGAGETKWDAIRSALSEFLSDPASDGLGVGLQYFPLGAPGVPEACMEDTDCGTAGGACLTRACLPANNPLFPFSFQLCVNDLDCPGYSRGCAPFGECSLDPTYACFDLGAGGCQELGDCNAVTGECLLYASCEVGAYAAPDVEIGVLPGNGMALVDSLAAEEPIGLTPSSVALEGAIAHATEHAQANPTHRVIAVLATDGLPTECLGPSVATLEDAVAEVAGIAAQGLAGTPAIETYVIGVFAPEDPDAMLHLDTIAAAGGTAQAFLVDASGDVDAQFRAALDAIRGGTLACEFRLPAAPENRELDYRLVNVELTDAEGTRALFYVESAAKCGDTELGWYYDADPAAGGTPTKISVCPETCDVLRLAGTASVEVRLGCATITPE